MIKEALKTAEIHDSYEKLKKEAEHVAKLIDPTSTNYWLHYMPIYFKVYIIKRYLPKIAEWY